MNAKLTSVKTSGYATAVIRNGTVYVTLGGKRA